MKLKETLLGCVPDDWTVATFGEIAELRQGLQISKELRINHFETGYMPLLKIIDLYKKEFSEYVTDIKEQYIAREEDIIYTRTGQVGLVYTDLNGCVHNNCFKIIVDYDMFDKYYIYYYLKSRPVLEYSNNVASGSVQKDLKHSAFKSCIIGYPLIGEQKAISNILSTLDEKIETNNQINKNLESMAQEIFKHWFVDFEFPDENGKPYKSSGGVMVEIEEGMIPKGWKVTKLGDIINLFDSKRIPLSKKERENREKKYPYYGAASLVDYVDNYIFDGVYVLMGEDGTVVDDLGYPTLQYVWGKFWVNNHAHVLKGKEGISEEFIYILLRNTSVLSAITGAVQLKINQGNLKNLTNVLPSDFQLIEKFSNIINESFTKIRNNSDENEKLIELRNTLIPKLMSGQLRVPLDN